jgi:hypothetical protein
MVELIEFYKLFGKKKPYLATEYDVFCHGTERYFRRESSVGIT